MPLFHLTAKLVEMELWELACIELDTAHKTEVDIESKSSHKEKCEKNE